MNHEQFEHIIRAAGGVLGVDEIVVIGSQAILASFTTLPLAATMSMEADILDEGDELDGPLGELSPFHEQFGIYADGVDLATAKLPAGWEERLVSYANVNTNGITARCLEPHDLVASKLYAGREKDTTFCRALIRAGLVDPPLVAERVNTLPVTVEERTDTSSRLDRLTGPDDDVRERPPTPR